MADTPLEPSEEESRLLILMRSNLSGDEYLKLYPDVAKAGCDPFIHWIKYGAME